CNRRGVSVGAGPAQLPRADRGRAGDAQRQRNLYMGLGKGELRRGHHRRRRQEDPRAQRTREPGVRLRGPEQRVPEVRAGKVERGKMTEGEFDDTLARISFTQSVNDLRGCDLVVEAVPESLDLKKSVFSELDGLVKKDAIFASNTSGFAISDLNKAVSRRDRF